MPVWLDETWIGTTRDVSDSLAVEKYNSTLNANNYVSKQSFFLEKVGKTNKQKKPSS